MSNSQVRAIAFGAGPGSMWVGYAGGGIDIFTDPTLATRSGRLTESDRRACANSTTTSGPLEMNGDSVWIGPPRDSPATPADAPAEREHRHPAAVVEGAVQPAAIDARAACGGRPGRVCTIAARPSVEVFTARTRRCCRTIITSMASTGDGDVWIGTTAASTYNPDGSLRAAAGRSRSGPLRQRIRTPRSCRRPASGSSARESRPVQGRVFDVRGRVIRNLPGTPRRRPVGCDGRGGPRVAPGLTSSA